MYKYPLLCYNEVTITKLSLWISNKYQKHSPLSKTHNYGYLQQILYQKIRTLWRVLYWTLPSEIPSAGRVF